MPIRSARPGDPVRDVVVRAFGREQVGELLDGLAPATRLSLVAEVDDVVVGHVLLTRGWLDAPSRLVDVLVLSPLGVVPEAQGQGFGGQLVAEALRRAAAPLVFLEGSPRYYSRFGFRPAGALGFAAPSVRVPPAGFQVAIGPGYEPWMSGALVYAEAFWVHDCVGLRSP